MTCYENETKYDSDIEDIESDINNYINHYNSKNEKKTFLTLIYKTFINNITYLYSNTHLFFREMSFHIFL